MRRRLAVSFLLVLTFCLIGSVFAAEPTGFPPEARARYDQGKDLQKQGRHQEALDAFDEAAKLGMTNFPRLYLARAVSQQKLRAFDPAIAAYSKIIDGFGVEDSCRY